MEDPSAGPAHLHNSFAPLSASDGDMDPVLDSQISLSQLVKDTQPVSQIDTLTEEVRKLQQQVSDLLGLRTEVVELRRLYTSLTRTAPSSAPPSSPAPPPAHTPAAAVQTHSIPPAQRTPTSDPLHTAKQVIRDGIMASRMTKFPSPPSPPLPQRTIGKGKTGS